MLNPWSYHEQKRETHEYCVKIFLLLILLKHFTDVFILTGLVTGQFTLQASKPVDAQTRLANIVDALVSKSE